MKKHLLPDASIQDALYGGKYRSALHAHFRIDIPDELFFEKMREEE